MEVDVEAPAQLLVEGLGAVDVGDRQRRDLEGHRDGGGLVLRGGGGVRLRGAHGGSSGVCRGR
jgi:hypothetical protein